MTLYPIDIVYSEPFEGTIINYGDMEATDLVPNMNWSWTKASVDISEPYNNAYFHIIVLF